MGFTLAVEMTQMTCGRCSGTYAITEVYRVERQQKGGNWHCPYCQTAWSYERSDLDRIKKELAIKTDALANERARHDQTKAELETTERSRRAIQAAARRTKDRIAHGVCPCCNRQFANLARHMTSKHPAYKEES